VHGALSGNRPRDVVRRSTVIGIVSFLTLIDLFGTQALLPQLVSAYGVDAGTMGIAVNASTVGMAVAGLLVAWHADRIDRKRGIWLSLALLSIPTALLGVVDGVAAFGALRILQGMAMATAFTLTMTYLSEECDKTAAGGAMAAYVTGNVASNLFGRLIAASAEGAVGLPGTFWLLAGLNLAGAATALVLIGASSHRRPEGGGPPLAAWRRHLAEPALRASFALGFVILFAFVGVFTYVNLELVGPRLGLAPAALGLVYFVFLPSLVTTPMAGRVVRGIGPRRSFHAAVAIAGAGLLATLAPSLPAVLAGLALVAVGTFFAQAAATAFVGRAARRDHAAANGLYLTSYYLGGLAGAVLLGQVYVALGWTAVVAVIAAALIAAGGLAIRLVEPPAPTPGATAGTRA